MILSLLLLIVWYVIWILLSWPPQRTTLVSGVVVALIVHWLTRGFFSGKRMFSRPWRYLWFIPYGVVFAWECLKANLDVAFRVLHPDVPIRPGTIKIQTNLKSDMGLTFLTNSLSLTPGNTTVDIDKEKGLIYVHRLVIRERRMKDLDVIRLPTAEKLEKILMRIFE